MLVLSRDIGQRIVIGDGIVVTMLEVNNGRVRIGIDAWTGTPVHREEVWQEQQREQQRAAAAREVPPCAP